MSIPRLPVANAGSFFAGGRAPLCWQQQMKRPSTTAKTIERACNWLPELTGQPAPKLQTRPLLGDCLAELVIPVPPVEEPAPATEPKRPKANEQRPSTDHTINRKVNHFPAQQQKDGPKPGTQPTRATAAVLSRLAGHSGSSRLRRPTSKASQPLQIAKAGQPAPLPTSNHREWPKHVATSVRRRLSARTPAQTVASGLERLPAPEFGLPQDLAAQWQQPLTGQTVSAAQLAIWENKAGNGRPAEQATDNGRATTEDKSARLREPEATAARPTASPSFYRRGRRAAITSGRRQNAETSVAEASLEAGTAVYPTHYTETTDEVSVDTTDRFAPPQMAATLPGLRPPPWPGAVERDAMGTAVALSASVPIATLVARESAKREAATAPEDLDDLARKLTQILEEESRRHGIDV